jgi:hypothetical protein
MLESNDDWRSVIPEVDHSFVDRKSQIFNHKSKEGIYMSASFQTEGIVSQIVEGPAWHLARNAEGRLVLSRQNGANADEAMPVQAVCCFPWSKPQEYISLRDDKGHEQVLIEALDSLNLEHRQLIEEELALRNFLPRVTQILDIIDQMEFFHWQVMTTAGPRSFHTRRHKRPRQLGNGQMMIRDICNDIYLVSGSEDMDAKSLRLLWVYLD